MNKTNLFDCTVYCLFCITCKVTKQIQRKKIYLKKYVPILSFFQTFIHAIDIIEQLFTPPFFFRRCSENGRQFFPRFMQHLFVILDMLFQYYGANLIRFCKYNGKRHAVFTQPFHEFEVYLLRFVPTIEQDKKTSHFLAIKHIPLYHSRNASRLSLSRRAYP